MSEQVNAVAYLRDLPIKAREGEIYYIDESKDYFTKPVRYIWKSGAWHIEYIM
ncbi:hypothetical protein [Brevibacillus sp. NRS-1366]|uniref:hypothetical protein n=1 Tax=Brevibacillus sp. NRS-1366 TaxID=3233899 RepID=UPI003D1B8FEB